jgi:hypothetical protein
MNTNQPENAGKDDQALEVVKFGDPECRYESRAIYENPQTGHRFEITISSRDEKSLNNFHEEDIRLWLEVKPSDASQQPEPDPDRKVYEYEDEGEPAVTFAIDVLDAGGIEPPYIVAFRIDPLISNANQTSPQTYLFFSTQWIKVNLHADQGNMDARLRHGTRLKRINFANPGVANVALIDSSGSPTNFYLIIRGGGQFDLSGEFYTS